MAVPFTVTKKNIPRKPNPIIAYYPRVASSGVLDLEDLSERVSVSCSATQSDCYAVIISLVATVSKELDAGKIVRLGHLGAFQISVKGTASATPEAVSPKNVNSASVIFRPGKKFQAMLKDLKFIRK